MKAVWIVPLPFMVAAVAYGLYMSKALPLAVGLISLILYLLSLRNENEKSTKLTGLVAMFSSIFALWENMINYLAMLGAASLILLELSREMHKRKYDFEEVI